MICLEYIQFAGINDTYILVLESWVIYIFFQIIIRILFLFLFIINT